MTDNTEPSTLLIRKPPKSDEAADLMRRLLIESPLYAKIEGDADLFEQIDLIISAKGNLEFDLYCVRCKQVTPWAIRPYVSANSGGGSGSRYQSQIYVPTVKVVNAVCLRKQHFNTYVLSRHSLIVQKIGQMPSMADMAFGELKAIPGIGSQDRKELGRALGLFSHDTPLGAFVYLRRVFERMILRAHEQFKEDTGAYIDDWQTLRMGERIKALGSALPGDVSKNAGVFGLLSRGIHELSDEDAEVLFPLVKAVIFQMLGDEERHRQSAIERRETQIALQAAIARHTPVTD